MDDICQTILEPDKNWQGLWHAADTKASNIHIEKIPKYEYF